MSEMWREPDWGHCTMGPNGLGKGERLIEEKVAEPHHSSQWVEVNRQLAIESLPSGQGNCW